MKKCVIGVEMCDWRPDKAGTGWRSKIIMEVSDCQHLERRGTNRECRATERGQCPAIKFPKLAEEVEARWGVEGRK